MEKLSLDYILKNSRWVAKIGGACIVGTYDKIYPLAQDPACKDYDLVCAVGQPKELQKFYFSFDDYTNEHGFITIQDFYKKVWTA